MISRTARVGVSGTLGVIAFLGIYAPSVVSAETLKIGGTETVVASDIDGAQRQISAIEQQIDGLQTELMRLKAEVAALKNAPDAGGVNPRSFNSAVR